MLGGVEFSLATDADLPAVRALIESAYRGDESRAGWTTEADLVEGPRTTLDELRQILATQGNVFLLARDDDRRLAACAHLQRRGDAAYFGMFAVDPHRQAGGIGNAMLIEAERIARDDWHSARMTMQVIEVREELIRWYERRGYRRTGDALPFPYDVQAGRGPRMKELRFLVLEKGL